MAGLKQLVPQIVGKWCFCSCAGEFGTIEGAFGASGKFRVNIPGAIPRQVLASIHRLLYPNVSLCADGLKPETMLILESSKRKAKGKASKLNISTQRGESQ